MDFMADRLEGGRALRPLNALDDFNRESLGIEVDCLLPPDPFNLRPALVSLQTMRVALT